MKTFKVVMLSLSIFVVLFIFFVTVSIVSFRNTMVEFDKRIDKQVIEMKASYNKYLLQVKEAAQVPDRQMAKLTALYDKLLQGRKAEGAMMKWITESNPSVNQDTFVQIQRIVEAGRGQIFSLQQVHIDTVREYNTLIAVFPNNIVNNIFLHRSSVTATIPLADGVQEIYKTNKDKEVTIFGKD